jgi:hypothetical protein
MIRIQITKQGNVTNQADFPSRTIADEWLLKEQTNKSFGKNDRELIASKDIDGNYFISGEDLSTALSFRDETNEFGEIKRFYSFKAEYDVLITDVTAEYDLIEQKKLAIDTAKTDLLTTKPVMTVPELSDAINKILLVLGIK